MSRSLAHTAIDVLTDLAQRGEVDPWDVAVIEVVDQVLNALTYEDPQELSTSGQTFLYASMLVLLKAETLAAMEPDPEELTLEAEEFLFLDDSAFDRTQLPLNLENHLHRRPVAHPVQRRRVTLEELIEQLELMAVTVERQSLRRQTHKVVRPSKLQSARAIANLSHEENPTEVAAEVEKLLEQYLSSGWMDVEDLLRIKNDRVGVFWALLLLCAQSKVELYQEDFYGPLKLRSISIEEAVGDSA
ncbi:segregation/condensation protein A [Lyngbya confervoides]|uniref:Segregation and condensation protein A n=1 Tax=Lyngbya confervoides BDU141951 TaxID=1574623 RepID=A0ABD4T0Y5_9CYAN|nr:segregation/condensation protein A [Lyngbya confervoides]MCM1982095.1 segregation/condensation protein A [Lyngbya confervoides BDU141951]